MCHFLESNEISSEAVSNSYIGLLITNVQPRVDKRYLIALDLKWKMSVLPYLHNKTQLNL